MHLSRVTIAAAIITLNVASFIALSGWTTPHPADPPGPESYAISGELLVGAVVEPVLDAADAAIDNGTLDIDPTASVDEVADKVLPEDMPPPPGPPLPAGLEPRAKK